MSYSAKVKEVYYSAMRNARVRGINWEFTREGWHFWWLDHLGPNWLTQRGTARGQYVMARKGDTGPYAPWNVECITTGQNHQDQYKNGRYHGKQKHLRAEAVRYIYQSAAPQKLLAKQHGILINTVSAIKRGATYSKVTKGLTRGYARRKLSIPITLKR